MKKQAIIKLFTLTGILFFCTHLFAQNAENWTAKQLMEPKDLADAITFKNDIPVIINVGPDAVIPQSIDAGMAKEKEGIKKLKSDLGKLSRDAKVVIYCGCCPFEHCPNVRPAINVLKEMKFTNYYLLNLPHNIKTDWIDKRYPVAKN